MSNSSTVAEPQTALQKYLQLDLSGTSPAARDLHGRVEREAALPDISLTGDGDAGSLSPNLTPGMSAWLSDNVTRLRQGALSFAESKAGRVKLDGGVQGIVRGIETDRQRRHRNQRRSEETARFYERHQFKLHEAEQTDVEYRGLKTREGGREAQTPALWIDLAIPLAIMIPEFFMNYVSFTKLAGVPAIGFGLSAVVALAVALSAFMTGTFVKAYSFYMHSDREGRRSRGLRQIAIAVVLLLVSLCSVAYARYHMVMEQWEAAKVIGLPLPSVPALTLGLLAGNLLVFALGAGVTFMIHDENPDYARKAKLYHTFRAFVDAAKKKQLEPKLRQIESAYRQKTDLIGKMAILMESQPDSHVIDDMMAEIEGKDGEVLGLLANYRAGLVERLTDRDPDFGFSGPVTERHATKGAERLTLAEFNAAALHLYRSN
jgi:hypothetical protein